MHKPLMSAENQELELVGCMYHQFKNISLLTFVDIELFALESSSFIVFHYFLFHGCVRHTWESYLLLAFFFCPLPSYIPYL